MLKSGAIFAVFLLVACTGSSASSNEADEPSVTMLNDVDMSSFSLPLDAYWLSNEDRRLQSAASFRLYERCMSGFGFSVTKDSGTPLPEGWGDNERRYGIHDLGEAQRYGYKASFDVEGLNQTPREATVVSPEQDAVARGVGPSTYGGMSVPEGGCLGEASRGVGGETGALKPDSVSLRKDMLSMESSTRSQADSRVRAAFSDWSDCMSSEGFDYTDPSKANNDPAFATDRPSTQEVSVAVADVRCKAESDLIDTWASVETAYQNQIIEQNAAALAEARDAADEIRRRSAEVMSE